MSAALGVSELQLTRLSRVADRVLAASPRLPRGQRPRRARAGRGLEFLEHRPYREGDDLRDLDWRASARSRDPLVRTHRDEAFSAALLCLDRSASMGSADDLTWRLARQLTAALGYLLLHAGSRVGLLVFSADIDRALAPARGPRAYGTLVRELTELAPRVSGGASNLERCARRVPEGACAIVISDFLAPDFMRRGLEPLRRRGARVQALQVLDPAPRVPEAPGTQVLWDVETNERRSIRITDDVRNRASANLEELCSALRRYCLQTGIALTRCDRGDAWQDVTLEHLHALSPSPSA